jgi:hypothetical protein
MSLLDRLRPITARVLLLAAFAETAVRRGGYGAAGLRLKQDHPILATWESLAAAAGTFPERCLFYAALFSLLVSAASDLARGGGVPRLVAAVALGAGSTSVLHALTGSPLPFETIAVAAAAFLLALRAARFPGAPFRAPSDLYGLGVALALAGDVVHRIWAFLVVRRGAASPACEGAAELAVPLGVLLAGIGALRGPRRKLAFFLGGVAGGGALLTALASPGAAGHVVRQLFDLGQAGLPSDLVLGLAVAAIAAAAAAFALPGAAPPLFLTLVAARHLAPAPSLALLAAGLLAAEVRERKRFLAP